MEIKVGDYVRSRAGYFYKIIRIDENGLIYWNKIQCGWSMEQLKDIVAKHSKNIIDLVEVGDYVNGERITDKWETRISSIKSNFSEEDIKTVVTHEQFANIEYKVEEGK